MTTDNQEAHQKIIDAFQLLFKFNIEYSTDSHLTAMINAADLVELWDKKDNKDRPWHRWHHVNSEIKPDRDDIPLLLRGTIVGQRENMIGYEVGCYTGGHFCVNNDLVDFIPEEWSVIR